MQQYYFINNYYLTSYLFMLLIYNIELDIILSKTDVTLIFLYTIFYSEITWRQQFKIRK